MSLLNPILPFPSLPKEPGPAARVYPKAAVCGKNEEAVQGADLVILAVKPQMAHKAVTAEMLETLPKEAAILSIMGSFDLAKLHALVPAHAVIRAMPNTPLLLAWG